LFGQGFPRTGGPAHAGRTFPSPTACASSLHFSPRRAATRSPSASRLPSAIAELSFAIRQADSTSRLAAASASLGLRDRMAWPVENTDHDFRPSPQAFRSALPAIGGQNILLLKGTALASTITVFELMGAANLVRADLSGLRASVRRGSWIFLASGIDHGWFRFFRETTCSTVSSGTGSDHLFIPHRVH